MPKLRLSFNQLQLLAMLVCTDVVFMALHALYNFVPSFDNPLFSISRERSYAELFQYIKEFWLFLLLAVLAFRTRTWLWLSWSLVFGFLLVDDSVALHEAAGKWLAARTILSGNWAELLFAGSVLALLCLPIAFGYWRATSANRVFTHRLLMGLGALALFGGGGDVLHGLFKDGALSVLAAIVEDGGEMLAMSGMLWFVFTFGVRLVPEKQPAPRPAVVNALPQNA